MIESARVHSQNLLMTEPNSNRIKELRVEKNLSQAALAERLGTHWVTLSKLERGKQRLTQDWMTRIAAVLEVQPQELLSDPAFFQPVRVDGRVNDGGVYKASKTKLNRFSQPEFAAIVFGNTKGDKSLWLGMSTDRFYPFYRIGDLIKFTFSDHILPQFCEGKLSLVIWEDDEEPPLVGFLSLSSDQKSCSLTAPGHRPTPSDRFRSIALATMVALDPRYVSPAFDDYTLAIKAKDG